MNGIIDGWVSGNRRVFGWLNPTPISVHDFEGLGRDQWVLVLANHQSWTDILILQNTLRPHLPPLKFFTKRELLWLPFLGQAMWALDFPFMHRYSPAYLERHPEKRGKDLETTRQACAHFRHTPTAVINFVEGTRWTPEKHAAQASPYPRLLKPRAGGIGYVLSALGDQLDRYVDVTLRYHTDRPNFWRFLCGRLGPVDVIIEQGPLPEAARRGLRRRSGLSRCGEGLAPRALATQGDPLRPRCAGTSAVKPLYGAHFGLPEAPFPSRRTRASST